MSVLPRHVRRGISAKQIGDTLAVDDVAVYVARALKDRCRLTAACLSGQAPIVRWGEAPVVVQRLKARPQSAHLNPGWS